MWRLGLGLTLDVNLVISRSAAERAARSACLRKVCPLRTRCLLRGSGPRIEGNPRAGLERVRLMLVGCRCLGFVHGGDPFRSSSFGQVVQSEYDSIVATRRTRRVTTFRDSAATCSRTRTGRSRSASTTGNARSSRQNSPGTGSRRGIGTRGAPRRPRSGSPTRTTRLCGRRSNPTSSSCRDVVSRRSDGTLGASIVDPHGDHLADARAKIRALAAFAEQFGDRFVRVESVAQVEDGSLRVLDLADPAVRAEVLAFPGGKVTALYESEHSRPYV